MLKCYVFLALVFISLISTLTVNGASNVNSTDSDFNVVPINGLEFIMDNDILKVSLSLKETLSSGSSVSLTPSNPSSISIPTKYCINDHGEEVLVIKKRSSYYSLTAIHNITQIVCSFNVHAFFVIENPVYSLTLSSSLFSPLSVDWTSLMYQGDFSVKLEPDHTSTSYATTSKLSLSLDTKSQSVAGQYIPLTVIVALNSYYNLLTGQADIDDFNAFRDHYSDCVDSSGRTLIKFHYQNYQIDYSSSESGIVTSVLAQVVDTDYSRSLTKFDCVSNFRHLNGKSVRINLDTTRYLSPSLFLNKNVTSTDSYNSSLGRLMMKPFQYELVSFEDIKYIDASSVSALGKELYFRYDFLLGGSYPKCAKVRGLQTTSKELNYYMSSSLYDGTQSDRQVNYDSANDEWTLTTNSSSSSNINFRFFSTLAREYADVTWAYCDQIDPATSTLLFKPIPIDVSSDPIPSEEAKVLIYTPSQMTSSSPITVDLLFSLSSWGYFNIPLPYSVPNAGFSTLYSRCTSYRAVDVPEDPVLAKPYVLSHFKVTATLNSNNILNLQLRSYYRPGPLVRCQIFGNYHPNLLVDDFSGENAKITFNDHPLRLDPQAVQFTAFGADTNALVDNSLFSPASLNMINQPLSSTPSMSIDKDSIRMGEYSFMLNVKDISVVIVKDKSDNYDFSINLTTVKDNFLNGVYMASPDSGYVFNVSPNIVIRNHPDAVSGYNDQNTPVILSFTLFCEVVNSFMDIMNKPISLYINSNLITEVTFPSFSFPQVSVSRNHGKGSYLITEEELTRQYLTNPQSVDSATIHVTFKTKYALKSVNLMMFDTSSGGVPYIDFITRISVISNISPDVDPISHKTIYHMGVVALQFTEYVDEYEEEKEITISVTSLINIFTLNVQYETVLGEPNDTPLNLEGVGKVAYVVRVPVVISSGYDLATSNINFNYTKDVALNIGVSNLWNTHYYDNNNIVCPVKNFNIFNWNDSHLTSGKLVFNEKNTPTTLLNIPTLSQLSLDVTYLTDSTVEVSDHSTLTFTSSVYLPDFSHIVDIVRVNNTKLPEVDSIISPNTEYIAFAFSGYVFSPVSKLVINTSQLPVRVVECTQFDQVVPVQDVKTTTPYLSVHRDFSNSNPFEYEKFTVMCKFAHLSTAELREGKYTGVLSAALESPTLGQSTTTSVCKGYQATVPIVHLSGGKDTVVVDSQVTIRDTPSTGLTPKEIESILDKYKDAKKTVSGSDQSEVYIDDIKTYPVGGNKYDTDVNIVISPSDQDSSLSLKDVQDINDKFVLDLSDSWEVSVTPPTYNVEIDECKGKCGKGCRLCRNDESCTLDADCLHKNCDSKTQKCIIKLIDDNDNGTSDVYVRSFLLSILFMLLSILFV